MFQIGDRVVYPMHGAGVIEAIEEKEILGQLRQYFVLRLPLKSMKVLLPVDNIECLGIRQIMTKEAFDEVFKVLQNEVFDLQTNWNRRYRANMEKVKTGDIFEVATVVRDLIHIERAKGLSTGERKMLTNTKQILISEMILATDVDESEADGLINAAVH
jgi:CarD family transcriptional regulator